MRDVVKLYYQARSAVALSVCLLLSGCAQHPAPIEFDNHNEHIEVQKEQPKTKKEEVTSHTINIDQLIPVVPAPTQVLVEPPAPTPPVIEAKNEILMPHNEVLDGVLEELDLITDTHSLEPQLPVVSKKPIQKEAPIVTELNHLSGLPVAGQILDKFGSWVDQKKLTGINITAAEGAPVKAVFAGTVIYLGHDPAFGKLVIIKQKDGELLAAYAHLADYTIVKNASIEKGQVIGHVGSTGNAKQPMLHIAIRKGSNQLIDPMPYLK